jgi:apolipoprotein D and lipocalin family protein
MDSAAPDPTPAAARQIPRVWLGQALAGLALAVAIADGAAIAAPDQGVPVQCGTAVGCNASAAPAPGATAAASALPSQQAAGSAASAPPVLGGAALAPPAPSGAEAPRAGIAEPAPRPGPPRAAEAPRVGAGPVTAVAAVELERYAGLWHELARIPNRFQRQCARESLAVYGLQADGRLRVLNQCRRANGRVDQAQGVAEVVDPLSKARLRVSLVDLLGWRPFWGDYWIIGLDPAYRWAIVGSPDRRYGWVLARRRALEPEVWRTISAILERQGYRPAAFQPSAP